ncbi:MAG: hypothetical protein MK102_13640 [Fuerstiella sp.]|nr:hypothetical protein [Fuerstiella sp.]
MLFEELRDRLLKLSTACVCDANKMQRSHDPAIEEYRIIDSAIRPVQSGRMLVGMAHTVSCHNDFLTVIKALRDAVPGEVLVIDSQNSDRAVTGGLFPAEANRKGLAGIVVDGPCRDITTIRSLSLPYYARSVIPIAGMTSQLFETQVPVSCGGVVIHPGDILLGDDDGIVVATLAEFSAVLPLAEQIHRKEALLLRNMAEGRSLLDMLNFEEHCAAVDAGIKSTLEFTA